jgi:hypothetical protein
MFKALADIRMCYYQLIHHTVSNFNIHGDKNALGRINDSLSTLQQARDLRLRDAEHALKSNYTFPHTYNTVKT